MWETLESRRMMSVSTTTSEEPVVTTTTTTIALSPEQEGAQALSMLVDTFNSVIKSLGDGLTKMARAQ